MPETRYRYYVFTLNNPTEAPDAFADRIEQLTGFKYLSFQIEIGESGTEHFQGTFLIYSQYPYIFRVLRILSTQTLTIP